MTKLNLSDSNIRKCKICGLEKDISNFGTRCTLKDGISLVCKQCTNEEARKRRANLTPQQREQRKIAFREYLKWYNSDEFKMVYQDPLVNRIRHQFRQAVKKAYTAQNIKCPDNYVHFLGCSFEEFKTWLESHFESGMTWKNHGEWEYDHIYPCASVDLFWESEALKCFNYKNIVPRWKEDHARKSNEDIRRCWPIKYEITARKNVYILELESRLSKYEDISKLRFEFLKHN